MAHKLMNITREIIKKAFELTKGDSPSEFMKQSTIVYKTIGNIRDKKGFFDLLRVVFRKKINIRFSLKLLDFEKYDNGYITWNAKFLVDKGHWDDESEWVNIPFWEDVRIEVEIGEYKVVANIIFKDTGEIRQSQWRPEMQDFK